MAAVPAGCAVRNGVGQRRSQDLLKATTSSTLPPLKLTRTHTARIASSNNASRPRTTAGDSVLGDQVDAQVLALRIGSRPCRRTQPDEPHLGDLACASNSCAARTSTACPKVNTSTTSMRRTDHLVEANHQCSVDEASTTGVKVRRGWLRHAPELAHPSETTAATPAFAHAVHPPGRPQLPLVGTCTPSALHGMRDVRDGIRAGSCARSDRRGVELARLGGRHFAACLRGLDEGLPRGLGEALPVFSDMNQPVSS